MPPKRKAAPVALVEEGASDAEPKRGRAGKKVDENPPEAAGNGEAKSKRGRGKMPDKEPKPIRGRKAAMPKEPEPEAVEEVSDEGSDEPEPEPVVEEVKKKGRGKKAAPKVDVEVEVSSKRSRRQVKAPVYDEDDELDEPVPSKGRAKKQPPAKAKEVSDEDDDEEEEEEEEEKPKGRGRAKKDQDDDEVDMDEKPKAKGRPKKEAASTSKADGPKNNTDTDYEAIDFSCDKENALGNTSNFVISSWNVDGLRAWLKKEGLKYLDHEKPDIFCVQESKCAEVKLPEEIKDLEGYKQFWHNSDKDGYAGVGLFSREEPISVSYGIGIEEHDDEGRSVTAEFDKFYVVAVYVPNSGKKLVNLPKRLEWNKSFRSYIKELDKKKPVIVCGDMNVAHAEIDLTNPKTNTKNAGFTKEEREGFTEFLADGYVDTFRELYPDKTGAYSFWTYMFKSRSKNVGWRLDYFIVSERFMDNICDSVIRSDVFGSDHCPLALFLNV